MIKFVAEGNVGKILGLGLSFGNLEFLVDGDPIFFDLEPLGSSGNFAIAYIAEIEELKTVSSILGSDHTLGVTHDIINQLKNQQSLEIPANSLDLEDFDLVVLFAGHTEKDIIETCRQLGLIDNCPIDEIEDYEFHEQGLVEVCPYCEAIKEPTVIRPPLKAPRSIGQIFKDWRQFNPILFLLMITLAIGLPLGLVITGYNPFEKPDPTPPSRSNKLSENTLKLIDSTKQRIKLIENRKKHILFPTLQDAPCPIEIKAPESLGHMASAYVRSSKTPEDSLIEFFERYLSFHQWIDLFPADKVGVGPFRKRWGNTKITEHGNDFPKTYQLSFIVNLWIDPVMPDDVEDQLDKDQKAQYRTGVISGQSLIWDLKKRKFICASPETTIGTPKTVTLVESPYNNGRHDFPQEDPLLKAQIETILGGIRTSVGNLKAIKEDKVF